MLHIWTIEVTYVDNWGHISGRWIIHIWPVIYLGGNISARCTVSLWLSAGSPPCWCNGRWLYIFGLGTQINALGNWLCIWPLFSNLNQDTKILFVGKTFESILSKWQMVVVMNLLRSYRNGTSLFIYIYIIYIIYILYIYISYIYMSLPDLKPTEK